MPNKISPPYITNLNLVSLNDAIVDVYRHLNRISDSADEVTFRKTKNGTRELILQDGNNKLISISDLNKFTSDTVSSKQRANLEKKVIFSEVGPTDTVYVNGLSFLEIDTSSNNVTIGGFRGGVEGQFLSLIKTNTSNTLTIENNESIPSGANQKIYTLDGVDCLITDYGGIVLHCNGSSWVALSNPSDNFTASTVGIGITAPTTTLDVEGTVSYKHTAFSTTGPTDNIDVSDTTILECNTTSNNITIGGFTGGVQGQVIYIVKTSTNNFITLEHNEGGGSQDIFLTSGANERVVGYGGYTLYCNGSHWFSLSNPTGAADAG